MTSQSWLDRLLRAGSNTPRDVQLDYVWLLGLGLLLIATGIGLRDPWPADEPRFALVVRDMLATGEWLLPRVGGDIYADKPPLFFWMMGVALAATGSLRAAFLLPSLLAALGCVVLVYDLGRRLWNRETGLAAGLALLLTVQFVWQARQAQIDATLCFWTTLSLYALLRHLLLGPAWGWYALGWAAAGLGVITKGVGFLPLLVLIPFALLRDPRWSPRLRAAHAGAWFLGPLAFVLAVSLWLVPMLLAAQGDATIAAYRDEILFRQTVDRYASAWHHREPFWYFIVNVIPWLWLPLTLLMPWLIPQWRKAWRERDLRVALLLSWIGLVVLFFSLSSGKRGVYVLPAVPAFALVCGPYLAELAQRQTVQRMMFILAATLTAICTFAAVLVFIVPERRAEMLADYDLDVLGPLILIAVAGIIICVLTRPRRGFITYAGLLATVLLVVSYWLNPVMNSIRSGAEFVARIEQLADPDIELGLIAFKEQYLLNLGRPIIHFGHARWREQDQEAADAARWLNGAADRQLVVSKHALDLCFENSQRETIATANRIEWYLVRGSADPACAARGRAEAVYRYKPPHADSTHE